MELNLFTQFESQADALKPGQRVILNVQDSPINWLSPLRYITATVGKNERTGKTVFILDCGGEVNTNDYQYKPLTRK